MNLSNALSFPFSNNNLVKILPIAIVYSIILFLVSYFGASENFVVFCGAAIAFLIFSFVIAGYYLSVLERLQANDENLPDVEVGRDVKRGFMSMIAGILYMVLPVIGLYLLFMMGFVFSLGASYNGASGASGGTGFLLVCGGAIVLLVMGIFLSWGMYIGFNRYVYEGRGLFALTENVSTAWSNAGAGLGLLWRLFVVWLLSIVVGGILGVIQSMMFPQASYYYFQPDLSYWMVSALSNVIVYTVTLIFGLSQFHLIAQYGALLGFTSETGKRKNIEGGGSNIGAIIAVFVVIFLCVLPIIVIVVLTILGPSIGNVFSNIIDELQATQYYGG